MGTSNCENCKDLEVRLQRALEVAQNRFDEYNKLLAEHRMLKYDNNILKQRVSDLGWELNPDGMGR